MTLYWRTYVLMPRWKDSGPGRRKRGHSVYNFNCEIFFLWLRWNIERLQTTITSRAYVVNVTHELTYKWYFVRGECLTLELKLMQTCLPMMSQVANWPKVVNICVCYSSSQRAVIYFAIVLKSARLSCVLPFLHNSNMHN